MDYGNINTLPDASSRSTPLLVDIRAAITGCATILLSRHQVISLMQEHNRLILAVSSYNKWKIRYFVEKVENYAKYVFTPIDTPPADSGAAVSPRLARRTVHGLWQSRRDIL
jgi:hypothetical protein